MTRTPKEKPGPRVRALSCCQLVFTFPPILLIGPEAAVMVDMAVIFSAPVVAIIAPFIEIPVVDSAPRHAPHEPISTLQIPALKFPVRRKPGRIGPCPDIHDVVIRDRRSVFDNVCRCICCTYHEQAQAEARQTARSFHDVARHRVHGRLQNFQYGYSLVSER